MADFTITEDFPNNGIEFDARFSELKACHDYLFQHGKTIVAVAVER